MQPHRPKVVRFADSSPTAHSVDFEDSEAAAVLKNLNSGSSEMPPRKSAMRRPAETTDEGVLRRSSRQQIRPSLPHSTAPVPAELNEQNPPAKQVKSNPCTLPHFVFLLQF